MDPLTFVMFWAFCVLLSIGAITRRLDEETRMFAALSSGISWVVWAFQALSIQTVNTYFGTATESFDALFYLGVALAMVMILVSIMRLLELYQDQQ